MEYNIFSYLFSRHVNSEDASLVRGLLGCLSVILRAQTKETWGYQSTIRVMESILPFVIDGRPKVRKAAQHAICGILARFVETRENSPRKACSLRFDNFSLKKIIDK